MQTLDECRDGVEKETSLTKQFGNEENHLEKRQRPWSLQQVPFVKNSI